MSKIAPCLWFDNQGEAAAQFYCSVFPNSRILGTSVYPEGSPGEPGTVMTVEFELDGQHYTALNGGPQFTFSEAISLQVDCADQAEIDHYWDALTADGGEPGPCGWLKDKFGLSWQVFPFKEMEETLSGPDPERGKRAFAAMMEMTKIDIATLRRAADGS